MASTLRFSEPIYPKHIESLLDKCEDRLKKVRASLRALDCPTLANLYVQNNSNDKVKRNTALFEKLGYLPNVQTGSKIKRENELMGLYVFAEKTGVSSWRPCYVGISRTVFRRLRQHGWGQTHHQASLAYAQAAFRHNHGGRREHLSRRKLQDQQALLREYRVVIVPELSDYDLYFLEVYLAGKLCTRWNSFRTH